MIAPVGHEQRSRMPAVPRKEDAQRGRRGDGGHDAQLRSLLLQQRALLYVQLHKRRHCSLLDPRALQNLL